MALRWTRKPLGFLAISLLGAMFACRVSLAAPIQVMESNPSAEAVMGGAATAFFIRFDSPVDHVASRLLVLQKGKIVEILHPRLQGQPDVLDSAVRRLDAGAYVLRWSTRSMQSRVDSHGDIPFTVR